MALQESFSLLRRAGAVLAMTVLIAIAAGGQTTDRNRPSPIRGSSLRAVVRRDSEQISDAYYFRP